MADWIITHTPAMLNQLWPKIQAAAAEEDITDSELPTSRQRIKKKAKAGKQKEPNLYNLSKQLERHTKQLSNIESTVQQFPKYLKNTVIQSSILKQLNTSINQLQKQVGQIQKSLQKKSKQQK
jgi:isoleucyl-tRNA synthetase